RKVFVIHNFLALTECEQLIERSEQLGYSDAPITTAAGFVMRKDIRDNVRVMLDDPRLATQWWDRARELLIKDWLGWQPGGFNERFRFYRYDGGQGFEPHMDGYFERSTGERSQFTFMVFLNEGFAGGATAFRQGRASLHVTPEQGKALVFYHHQVHEGMPVIEGRKYVLRTDVMYRH